MDARIKDCLLDFMKERNIPSDGIQVPDAAVDTGSVKVIMINEAPPADPDDFIYGKAEHPGDMKTTIPLFRNAGAGVNSIRDILQLGIYITTAVKTPKQGYTVETEQLAGHLPVLEYEIGLFPNVKVIMLMGDVAKKAFNMIARKKTRKNAVPAGSTYKIRNNEFYYEGIRIFPSYIMTGGNILIEKSKYSMVSDDIRRMLELI